VVGPLAALAVRHGLESAGLNWRGPALRRRPTARRTAAVDRPRCRRWSPRTRRRERGGCWTAQRTAGPRPGLRGDHRTEKRSGGTGWIDTAAASEEGRRRQHERRGDDRELKRRAVDAQASAPRSSSSSNDAAHLLGTDGWVDAGDSSARGRREGRDQPCRLSLAKHAADMVGTSSRRWPT